MPSQNTTGHGQRVYQEKLKWRSKRNPRAGKNIRRNKDGFENIEDYFTESDADVTRGNASQIERLDKENESEEKTTDLGKRKQKYGMSNTTGNKSSMYSVTGLQSTLGLSSQTVNSQALGVNPVGWYFNKNIGSRTGRNIRAGKNIRKNADGFDNFEDYLSESDASSIMEPMHRSLHAPRVSTASEEEEEDIVISSTAPPNLARSQAEISQGSAGDDEADSLSMLSSQQSHDDTLESTEQHSIEDHVTDDSDREEETPVNSPVEKTTGNIQEITSNGIATESVDIVTDGVVDDQHDRDNTERSAESNEHRAKEVSTGENEGKEESFEEKSNLHQSEVRGKSSQLAGTENKTATGKETTTTGRELIRVQSLTNHLDNGEVEKMNHDKSAKFVNKNVSQLKENELESDDNQSLGLVEEDLPVFPNKTSEADSQQVVDPKRKSMTNRSRRETGRRGKSLGNVTKTGKNEEKGRRKSTLTGKKKKIILYDSSLDNEEERSEFDPNDVVEDLTRTHGKDEKVNNARKTATVKDKEKVEDSVGVVDKKNKVKSQKRGKGKGANKSKLDNSKAVVHEGAGNKSGDLEIERRASHKHAYQDEDDDNVVTEASDDPDDQHLSEEQSSMPDNNQGKTTLVGPGLDVAGSNLGSITKVEDPTTGITPSFRTRKRLSYSAAVLDDSRNERQRKRKSTVLSLSSKGSIDEEEELNDNDDDDEVTSRTGRSQNPAKTTQQKTTKRKSVKSIRLGDTESESSLNDFSAHGSQGKVNTKGKHKTQKTAEITSTDKHHTTNSVYDISPDKSSDTSSTSVSKRKRTKSMGEVRKRGQSGAKGRKGRATKSLGNVSEQGKQVKNNVLVEKRTSGVTSEEEGKVEEAAGKKSKATNNQRKKGNRKEINKTSHDTDTGEKELRSSLQDVERFSNEKYENRRKTETKSSSKWFSLDSSDSENEEVQDEPSNHSVPLENDNEDIQDVSQETEKVGNEAANKSSRSRRSKVTKAVTSPQSDSGDQEETGNGSQEEGTSHKKGKKSARKSSRSRKRTQSSKAKRKKTDVVKKDDNDDEEGENEDEEVPLQDDVDASQSSKTATPINTEVLPEKDYLRSGYSIRHSRRLRMNNLAVEDDYQPQSSTRIASPAGPSPPKNRRLTEIAGNLTPILSKSSSPKRNKGRRVTISNIVTEQEFHPHSDSSGHSSHHSDEASSTPVVVNRRSMDADNTGLPSMSATPVHIFEVTNTDSPQIYVPMPDLPKLIVPEEPHDGLRRSTRVRCKPVADYKGERAIYDRRKSGAHLVGIQPSEGEMRVRKIEAERRKRLKSRKLKNLMKGKTGKSPRRNLSIHAAMDSDMSLSSDGECVVIDPGTGKEVSKECMVSRASQVFRGPTNSTPKNSDPFIMTVVASHEDFKAGVLVVRPLKKKPEQRVNKGTMTFWVEKGKVVMTIHNTNLVGETGDFFIVPRGNVYSVKNLRKEEARLLFQCHLRTDDG